MAMSKFDLSAWARSETALAAKVPVKLMRGLLTRTANVPAGTTALLLAEDGSRRLYPAGEIVPLDGNARVLFVRTAPLSLTFDLPGLVSGDAVPLDATIRIGLQAGRHELDMLALDERLLVRDETADAEALRRALSTAVTDAVRAFFAGRPMAEIMGPSLRADLSAAVAEGAKAACLECGVSITGLEQADVLSPAWKERLAAEARSRKAVEDLRLAEEIERRRHEGRLAKVEQLERLASRLDKLREQFPGASLEALIGRVEEENRGELYDALLGLHPDAQPVRRLYVAVGRAVYGFDPPDWSKAADLLHPSPQLGMVRSVRLLPGPVGPGGESGPADLAVGCQFGVHVLPADGTPARDYPLPAEARRRNLKGGINSVCRSGSWLFASHSEVGLTAWNVAEPGREGFTVELGLPAAGSARGVSTDRAGRIVASWGATLLRLDPAKLYVMPRDPAAAAAAGQDPDESKTTVDGGRVDARRALELYTGSDEEITCLLAGETDLLAGTSGGRLLRWPADAPPGRAEEIDRSPHKVYSLGEAMLGGVRRLLIGDNGFSVRARVLGDHKESRFRLTAAPVCFVAGGSDYIFAVDAAQAHIFVWKATDPERTVADIPIRRMTQHSVKDIAVLLGPKRG
jgi:hypothetical protein